MSYKPIYKLKKLFVKFIMRGFLHNISRKFWYPKKINLGDRNRNFYFWGWETADIKDADYIINFHEPKLPLEEDSCQVVYTSHMIEHISDDSAVLLFKEAYRVLSKDGLIRIVCPDLDIIIDKYEQNDLYFFLSNALWLFESIEKGILPKESVLLHNNVIRTLASYIETGGGPVVDYATFKEHYNTLDKHEFAKWCVSLLNTNNINKKRDLGHINAFSYDKLKFMLKKAGFKNIVRSSSGKSSIEELRHEKFDNKNKQWISLYVEANK